MRTAYFVTDIIIILLEKQLKNKLTPQAIIKVKRFLGLILAVFGTVLNIKGFLTKDKLNPQRIIDQIEEQTNH